MNETQEKPGKLSEAELKKLDDQLQAWYLNGEKGPPPEMDLQTLMELRGYQHDQMMREMGKIA